ncbi:hypothetical protein BDZ85DRAFT_226070 [Elsinoe ampelina]|uniref:Hydrophobic surface binding protein A-domain-containing protein n=1 Tax=Elsinoe ampelina TaxID=302913 RepID=A0A6A6FZD9_9PEZI|nr:hypothetical protein BDZ85DRAFT_226070 [Elsinoe ampelina]
MKFSLTSVLAGLLIAPTVLTQTVLPTTPSPTLTATPAPTGGNSTSSRPTTTSRSGANAGAPPDVYLNVPELSVGRIELNVDDLRADINLNAKVASLVTLNAGVQLSVQNINLTIADVNVELELVVRLGHLVDIVNRVFESVDLNPLIVSIGNATESLVGAIVSEVDGLLGTITQGGTTLSFIVDSLGNIVQQVTGGAGGALDTIVGNFQQNMTLTGPLTQLGNGLSKGTYSYSPLNALVDIVTNTAGQVVSAMVQKTKPGTGGSTSSTTAAATSSAAPTST